ncbi:hypothetical protein YPPY66_0293 [Yersinia pestis PY-66]|uniref:Uncharacterized protein n=1 Tax=Yersinia pestis TaxID=632 RepID=Q8CLS8_YERPE|nr:hypothetical [Yersinia pestis KIM10+]ADV97025.1 hypothetical protein YPC_0265 [Yersinia pestis biovar Medievalis str. Harbin 35]EEO74661.1 hypothetical protein YP516_4267 [Yersinia pestis Nepal516]EEO82400.1 hypothetical protein YPF_0367 [Yersinia pestis biovar Orientalis str. India 195]EEO86367.1 hypothetical protein YPH_2283 [Yersinia pestis biovar Orientalis str. PEXU2]EEO92669.1 hypothetical protein YPS_0103 [Yersinia pestis Pestoides A]EIQ95563.1 hypothetical protein YPPY02_0169 [Yers
MACSDFACSEIAHADTDSVMATIKATPAVVVLRRKQQPLCIKKPHQDVNELSQ